MPTQPPHLCGHPGCWTLTNESRCSTHKRDGYRGGSTKQGYDSRWARARAAWLAEHPLCVMCLAEGVTRAATVVDHIKPHKGDQRLFWDAEHNWQSLCKRHHDRKTATEMRLWDAGR